MFSIIIPVKELNDYIRETIPAIQRMDRSDWEVLIVTNDPQLSEWPNEHRVRMLSSGRVGPADKRDQGARGASGDYLVFLDDDSYPEPNLLSVASVEFEQGRVALGGPAITPTSDTFLQKVSGAVFSSKLTGGSPERYRPVGTKKLVDDWPSVNLMIRRDVFLSIGGFDSPYWPGEDTFLCLKLKRAGHHVMYVPSMIVWHHRREGLGRHARQVGAYGLHRGYFARHLPETSRRPQYFLPSAVFLLFLSLPLVPFMPGPLGQLILAAVCLYGLAIILGVVDLLRVNRWTVAIAAVPYVLVTHLAYGYCFIRGISMRAPLVSRLR